ncbi:MAG: hypothetical protein GX590_10420 [Lentisphaerae bacterium]|nr:hypothetical protein [Lentisphaerota bacterium]
MLERLMDDLESRLDAAVEEDVESAWKTFWDGRCPEKLFCPQRRRRLPPRTHWSDVRVNATLDSIETMAVQQLYGVSYALDIGAGCLLNIRANYGTGILSSICGAEIFRMDEGYNTLPTTVPLAGGIEGVKRLLGRGVPDLTAGWGGVCLDAYRFLAERMAPYPKLSRYVWFYHPDLQGPMDIVELLWGSSLFLDLLDNPDVVHELLGLVTDTYIRFYREWERIIPPRDAVWTAHWGMMLRGRLMLRDDSAMNLSPAMFETFIQPYDQRLLETLGGGAIHFCGRGDHYIGQAASLRGLTAINVSQPHLNDMEQIFRHTVDKGIRLLNLRRDAAEAALARGRDLHGRVHVAG